ncbi:hypothetical protein IE994_23250 [Enterobacter hormaechei]|nr:hypothetical protein [Enterobacter hormaechei]
MFDDKIAAFSAGSQGEMAVVLKDKETHAQHLRLLNSITTHDWQSPKLAMKQSVNGQQSDFHLGAIALHGGQILAVDPDGKLFSAAPPAAGASEINFSEDPRNRGSAGGVWRGSADRRTAQRRPGAVCMRRSKTAWTMNTAASSTPTA